MLGLDPYSVVSFCCDTSKSDGKKKKVCLFVVAPGAMWPFLKLMSISDNRCEKYKKCKISAVAVLYRNLLH